MPAKSIDPLKKVTVDLFKSDVIYLQYECDNFSEVLRKLLRDHVTMLKATKHRMTLGDLNDHG